MTATATDDIRSQGASARIKRMRFELGWWVLGFTVAEQAIRMGLSHGERPGLNVALFALLALGTYLGLKPAILRADQDSFVWRRRSPWAWVYAPPATALTALLLVRFF
ncbi:MAG TPA: hypothetical protein VF655_10055 [Allosphingosinicella sp.]|jgi:hypothetical protein